MQGKTFTLDPITHKRIINRGEEDKYYIESHHEPIISNEVFDKAQEILKKRSGARETGRRKGNYSRKFPFSSRLFCGFCGSVLVRRNLYKRTDNPIKVWQCMAYVKDGKNACSCSKVIREDIIESCFMEAYNILCNDNKEIINNFISRMENFINENNTESFIKKLIDKKEVLEEKQNSLLNLVIDGTIDKDIYNVKKIEINKKIKKVEKEIEQLECQLEDENTFDCGIDKIKGIFKNELNGTMQEFDNEIFEALIHKVIIGEKAEEGNANPYVIKFIVKNGFEQVEDKKEKMIVNETTGNEMNILNFNSLQDFVSFEKQEDGSLRKKLKNKIRVKVELNAPVTIQ